ncbi:type III PLP-dependent enzyme domain-containing protein [Peterkaempfera bronchialis]|uniref:Y4yA family PLP-dependent enzyme n=1 Tax=Peterkaempfera bronchialis TaxID=2126346 RepID=A0A345T4I2_9ACTN|nr:alanine racemase [Peterkaempfera bronchialis]AXI80887.1 Y4yA family PLP-dependent enzyme [Peterkaempfera bronchialis]
MGVPEPLYLAPRLDARLSSLLGSAEFLHGLVDALGSPLNVVLPEQISDNLERFRSVYRRHHLGGEVFFAHKANRSSALVRRFAATDAAVDAASLGELQHVLGAGFTPDRVLATGPKNPEFLWLAARTGATVNVDGRAELDDLAALVRRHGLPRVRILLRLSEFQGAGSQGAGFQGTGVQVLTRRSRFGSPVREVDGLLAAVERHRDAVELIGVAYHLDTVGLAEKAVALESCVTVMDECRNRGLQPRVIDIGGGFGVNYLADRAQWERYTTALADAVLGHRPAMTWRRHGYGLRSESGTLRGALGLYPSHRPDAGERYLDQLLSLPAPTLGRPLATLLLEHLYDLWAEPGRALVDQCGLTLARVLEVRRTDAGDWLVRLGMNAGDVSLEEHGVLMDPVAVPRGGGPAAAEPERAGAEAVGVYLAGNLCLEADLITRRMVFLPRLPRPGDLMGFANTAGYCMDFRADHAQQQPVARKVAAWQQAGSWRWCLDEEYWPITRPGGQA